MEFRVLGPTELWSAGQQCDLGAGRVRGALAILLLAPRTIVPAESLIDRLWDTRPPPKARESLSVYIARLRSSLRQAAGDSVRLARRADGYLLDVDPDLVDLHQFRRLRRQADSLAGGGDLGHAAQLLREADLLWRGPALTGLRGDWAARMRGSLEEERRAAIVKRVEYELELGRHTDLVGELHGLLAEYPLDEKLIAAQMTALYLSGRPGDALGLYREHRGRLAEEQGTEPGPELSDLQLRMLRHDLGASGASASSAPRPQTLPPQAAAFVGRGQELAKLMAGGARSPCVWVIEGMPGVGKTALAVEAARRSADHYPDGVHYLNLHSHDLASPSLDAAQALHRLLRMLRLPADQIPATVGERAALWRAQLSRRRCVVILDDASRHDQIRPLLPASGRSLVLITTRRRLPGIEDSRLITLDVLCPEDAVTLFTRIAGPGRADDREEAATAVGLCGRLPLAVQLTAGRLAQGHPARLADLIEEIARPPAQLGSAGAASPELTSAFDLSYRALEPDHQRYFRRLGMSPCPEVSLEGATALGGGSLAEAEKALAVLLDHHLLSRAPGGFFRFHSLIRDYAASRADQEDSPHDQRQAVGRLLDYYLHTADRADRILHPFRRRMAVTPTRPPAASPRLGTPDDAARWLELEWRNVARAAQHAGRHEWQRHCAGLAHVLAGFIEVRSYWDEAIRIHTMAVQACREIADQAGIARASLELSVVNQHAGRHEAALAHAEEAAAICRSLPDRRGLADALDQIGLANQRAARSREALAYFHEARALYQQAADQHGVAESTTHSGIACWHLGRYPDAMSCLREALALYRQVGDRRGEAKTLNNLGKMQLHCGYHRDALDSFQRSLQIFEDIGGAQHQAILHHNIGNVYHYKGSYVRSLTAYRQALAIYRSIGDLPDEADVRNDIGDIYKSAERYEEALLHYQRARAIAEEIGNLAEQVVALRGVADVSRGSGRYHDALDSYQAALQLARQIGDPYQEGKLLEGVAETTLRVQGAYPARFVFRQALDIFERLGVPEAESTRIRMETMEPALGRGASQAVTDAR